MAIRDAPPSVTPAAQLASSLVLMDMDPEMPELEKTPHTLSQRDARRSKTDGGPG